MVILYVENIELWVSIAETMDANGRFVVNVITSMSEIGNKYKIILSNSKLLEKKNHNIFAKIFLQVFLVLRTQKIIYDDVFLCLSDTVPYIVKAGTLHIWCTPSIELPKK